MTDVDRLMENRALLAALELSMLNLNNTTYSTTSPDPPNGLFDDSPESLLVSKKSQNITQCVSVPSSEHVAEIVGRQGETMCTDTESLARLVFRLLCKTAINFCCSPGISVSCEKQRLKGT